MRLSVRSANALARGDIFYIEDLTKMTQVDLLKARGLGRGCAAEVVSVLKEDYGFIMPLGYAEARKPGRPKSTRKLRTLSDADCPNAWGVAGSGFPWTGLAPYVGCVTLPSQKGM